MKLTIKNYKTLRNTKIEINKGEINYFIGSNESGKTNILNAIRIIGANSDLQIKKNDKTTIKHATIDEEVSFEFSYQSNPEISNKINEQKVQIWISKNLLYFNNYLKMLEKHQTELTSLKNNINDKIANLVDTDMKKSYAQTLKQFRKIIDKIKDNNLIIEEEFEWLNAQEKWINDSFSEKEKKFILDHFLNFYSSIKLKRPLAYFVQPMENAFKSEKTHYPWADLMKSDSLLKKILNSFSDTDTQKHLDSLYNNPDQNDTDTLRVKNNIIDDLNKAIKEYFSSNLSLLKGYPYFYSEGSSLLLDIKSNYSDPLEIDSGEENARSLGFKSFLRIILEIKSLSNDLNDIIYIIDEPEQGLHPLLQELLMEQIKLIIKNSKNITFILTTHSPYILSSVNIVDDKDKINVNFVSRLTEKNGDRLSGETIITKLADDNFVKQMEKKYNDFLYNDLDLKKISEDVFLLKMIYDSKNLKDTNKKIKQRIKDLHDKHSRKEITEDEFVKEIKKAKFIKNIFPIN